MTTQKTDNQTINVALGARAYDVEVGTGLIDRAGALLAPHLTRPWTVVVTDANVAAAQGERLFTGLKAAGVAAEEIVLAPGEQAKSFDALESLLRRLISLGVERSDLIIAFGGGVIGDLAGFAAGVLRRGCRFAQIPTTLLAQVDSSVGGKTAINAPEGKNLVGVFHQPAIVLADVAALASLPARERRAGYAEVVKYGAVDQPDFFDWLQTNGPRVLAGEAAATTRAVAASVRAKADIVAADEREGGARALLNLGHTFGHALEAVYGYDGRLLHGEAVAAGMGLAFDYATSIGMCPPAEAARLKAHLNASGLPASLSDLPPGPALGSETLIGLMMQDKKVVGGALTLILPARIGAARIVRDVDAASVSAFLKSAGAA